MINHLQRRSRLLMNISTAALLAALPSAMFVNVAMAQVVVVTEDSAVGLDYGDISVSVIPASPSLMILLGFPLTV